MQNDRDQRERLSSHTCPTKKVPFVFRLLSVFDFVSTILYLFLKAFPNLQQSFLHTLLCKALIMYVATKLSAIVLYI